MDFWIMLGWHKQNGSWEVLAVVFDETAIKPKAEEIFTEYVQDYDELKIEQWHRFNINAVYRDTYMLYKDEEDD